MQTSALVRVLYFVFRISLEFLKCGSVLCIPGSLSPGCVLGVYVRNVLNVWNVNEHRVHRRQRTDGRRKRFMASIDGGGGELNY